MEPEIRVDLPASSPIVAYGETRQPGSKKFLAILAGSFVLLLIGAFAFGAIFWNVALPKRVIAMAAVHDGLLPKIVGIAKTDTGFATFTVSTSDNPHAKTRIAGWPFITTSDASLEIEQRPMRQIASLISKLGSHQAFIEVDSSEFSGDGIERVRGPYDNDVWRTDAPLRPSDAMLLPGDISFNIQALQNAWAPIRDALKQSVPTLAFIEMPHAISWSEANGTPVIEARFNEQPASSTTLAFLTSAGIYDIGHVTLPDGSDQEILLPPVQELNATGTLTAPSSTTPLTRLGGMFVLGDPKLVPNQSCGNPTDAMTMDQAALAPILKSLNLPFMFRGVAVRSEDGKMIVIVCR